MQSVEILKIATARAAQLDYVPGGIAGITRQDVAHGMGYIKSSIGANLFYVKYMKEIRFLAPLNAQFVSYITDELSIDYTRSFIVGNRLYKLPKHIAFTECFWSLSRLALVENIHPNVCTRCLGSGSFLVTKNNIQIMDPLFDYKLKIGQIKKCGRCRGTGHKKMSDRERAKVHGSSLSSWQKYYAVPYRKIQSLLFEIEYTSAEQLRDVFS